MTNEDLINKIVEWAEVLKKCENTQHLHCDFCGHDWQDGLYCRSMGGDEYDDDWYCICGKCLLEMSCKYPFLHGINLMMKIDDIQPALRVRFPF